MLKFIFAFDFNFQPVISTDELIQASLSEFQYDPTPSCNSENSQQEFEFVDNVYFYERNSISDSMTGCLDDFSKTVKGMFLTRENTDTIFNLSIRLIEEYTQLCCSLLNSRNINENNNNDSTLRMALDYVRSKLSENNSSYKRHQTLVKSGLFVAPQEKAIGTHWEMIRNKSSNVAIPRLLQSIFHYIPMLQIVQYLFNQNEFKKMYFDYNLSENGHRCIDGVYKHFCCGSLYKNCDLFKNQPYALQLQIATDDFEICDALGSKAGVHKMCPIYFSIKNVPSQYTSKLSNMYLISLCRSDDIKTMETDFNDLWQHVVNEIIQLETIGINIDPKTNIKGTISYLGFDNLGANTSLGLVESFTSYFCRFCTVSKKESEKLISEDQSMLRTLENYNSHLEIVAESQKVQFAQTKGVKRDCALNKLNYFHILKNKTVDIMHDLNEGCILFLLKNFFRYCISKKVFTEVWLQKRIQFFDFGANRKNAPSLVSLSKENLNQNGSQLICLFRHIGFILHEFRENETVKNTWICVESLQQIVQICYSKEINENSVQLLEKAIRSYLTSILTILELKIPPKGHLLTHYPAIIREMGPVLHMSMLRYEARHKSLKSIATRSNNYINITKTISVRNQAELVYNGFTYSDTIDCGKISLKDISNFSDLETAALEGIYREGDLICEIEWFKCNDFTFRKKFAILYENQFHEIDRIIVMNDNYFLMCSDLELVQFDSFTHSVIIKRMNVPKPKLISFENLVYKKPLEIKCLDNKIHIFAETLDVTMCFAVAE